MCTPVGTGEGEEDGGEGGGGEVDMEAGEDGMEETGKSPIIAITALHQNYPSHALLQVSAGCL